MHCWDVSFGQSYCRGTKNSSALLIWRNCCAKGRVNKKALHALTNEAETKDKCLFGSNFDNYEHDYFIAE